jgi:hypothetical protein
MKSTSLAFSSVVAVLFLVLRRCPDADFLFLRPCECWLLPRVPEWKTGHRLSLLVRQRQAPNYGIIFRGMLKWTNILPRRLCRRSTAVWSTAIVAISSSNETTVSRDSSFDPSLCTAKIRITHNTYGNGSISIVIPPYFTGTTTYPYPSALHTIHVVNVLSNREVKKCYQLAQQYAKQSQCWNQPDHTRHVTYPTCDFPIDDCQLLQNYFEEIHFDQRIWNYLHTLYQIRPEQMFYLDLFCAHYQAADGHLTGSTQTMDRLEAHRDGSLMSFTITLNDPNEFDGGGTFFDSLRDIHGNMTTIATTTNSTITSSSAGAVLCPNGAIRPARAGDGVFHCGKLLHGGSVITSGSRTVLVGFVDVISDVVVETDGTTKIVRPGVLSTACRDWGRLDVATFRYQRQQQQTMMNDTKTMHPKKNQYYWTRKNSKWVPKGNCFSKICPILPTVNRQADVNYQRRKRLEIEDLFLRSILMSPPRWKEQNRRNLDTDDEHKEQMLLCIADRSDDEFDIPKFVGDDITIL